jgi:hypothetical protein
LSSPITTAINIPSSPLIPKMLHFHGTWLNLAIGLFFFLHIYTRGSWDNSVGIAAGYGLDGRGSMPGRGKRFFSTRQRLDYF